MEMISIFDLMPEEDAKKFKPIKSIDWKWTMANDYPKKKNGLKVFSCFACGGGSTMGYKLAGCEVIGCCEIDPEMNEVYICQATHDDLRIGDIFIRLGEKERCFNTKIAWEEKVLQTIPAKCDYYRGVEKERISNMDVIHSQTFPEDYDFMSESYHDVTYICGMSVPPIMIKRIVKRLTESGLFDYKTGGD